MAPHPQPQPIPLPSLARLSLEAPTSMLQGGRQIPKSARKTDGGPPHTTVGWGDLPQSLQIDIMRAANAEDPCKAMEVLCATNKMFRTQCEGGEPYEEVSAMMGLYGIHGNWRGVLEYYEAIDRAPPTWEPEWEGTGGPQKAYFRSWCVYVRQVEMAQRLAGDRMMVVVAFVLADEGRLKHPFFTQVLCSLFSKPRHTDLFVKVHNYAETERGGRERFQGRPDYHLLAKAALNNYGEQLQAVPTTRDDYAELAKIAVRQTGDALKYVPKEHDDWDEIAMEAVKHDGGAILHVPYNHENYQKLAEVALHEHPDMAEYIVEDGPDGNKQYVDKVDYTKLALIAVKSYADALSYFGGWDRGRLDFEKVAKAAVVSESGFLALMRCREWLHEEANWVSAALFSKLAEIAIRHDPLTLKYVWQPSLGQHVWQPSVESPDLIPGVKYIHLAAIAVRLDERAWEFVPSSMRTKVTEVIDRNPDLPPYP